MHIRQTKYVDKLNIIPVSIFFYLEKFFFFENCAELTFRVSNKKEYKLVHENSES